MNEFFIAIGCTTTLMVGALVIIILIVKICDFFHLVRSLDSRISELEDDLAHRRAGEEA